MSLAQKFRRKKMNKTFVKLIIAISAALLATACNNKKADFPPVSGAIDGPLQEEKAPEKVLQAMTLAYMDRYENVLTDNENGVSVWSLVWCNPDISSEGYGIHVVKDKVTTYFPEIYHGKNPSAWYDAASGTLWLACGIMEGTGVHVEKLYKIQFDDNSKAQIVAQVDPFDIQEAIRGGLRYLITGDEIIFFDVALVLCHVKNDISDMGPLDSGQPVWIGEQISYYFQEGVVYVRVVPGLKYSSSPALIYDNMPEFQTNIMVTDNGNTLLGVTQVLP